MSDTHQQKVTQLNQEIDQLREQGRFEQAIAKAAEVYQLIGQSVGQDQPEFATAVNQLGELYQAAGNYDQAKSLYPWALQIKRKALGQHHPEMAQILNNLGELNRLMGDHTQAEKHLKEGLEIRRTALGETHPTVGQSLNSLARLAQDRGHYAEAQSLYEQALALRRTALGETDPEMAQTLNDLAGLYQAQGQYGQARQLYEQALQIRQTALPETHPEVGHSLNNLAGLYYELGDYRRAEPLYQQALAINGQVLGEAHPAYAGSLDHLAKLYQAMGDYDRAELFYQQALQIRRKILGEKHPDFAQSVANLAGLHYTKGDYDKAKGLQQWAWQIKGKALGQKHPEVAQSQEDLARIWAAMGDYTRAEGLLEEALAIKRTALGEQHADVATSLDHLAELYRAMGDYAKAEPCYRQVLQIRQAILNPTHPDLATSLNNLAELYQEIGDYTQAESRYEQALEIRRAALGETHPAFAESLNNLAGLHYARGNLDQAKPLFEQVLTIRRAALGEKHPDVARSLDHLAELYRASGHYTEAKPLYKEAVEIWQATVGQAHPAFAHSLHHLAELQQAQGDYDQAKAMYQWALQIRQKSVGQVHPDVAQNLNDLATLYTALGLIPLALTTIQQATDINDQMIGQVFSIGSERQRMAYLKTFGQNFDTFLSLITQHLADSPPAVQSGLDMILRRKALGAEALAAQRDALMSDQYPALKSRLQELKELRQRLAQKTLAGPGPEGLERHQQTLTEWRRQKEELEAALARQIPEMNLTRKLQAVNQPVVTKALPEGTVLVEFVRFNPFDFRAVPAENQSQWQPARYLAFVLPAGQANNAQMIDLGEAKPIEQMIAAYRTAITGEVEGEDRGATRRKKPKDVLSQELTVGGELRATLFNPLLPALNNCRRIFLAPDGDLTRLPFEILPTDNKRRLIDDYQFSYLSVARDVLRFGVESSGQSTASLVVADPDFNLVSHQPSAISDQRSAASGRRSHDLNRAGLYFGRLPGTRKEGQQIADMLGVSPLLAEAALEGKLKAHGSPRILHIATHGFFLEDQELAPNEERLDVEPGGPESDKGLGRLTYGLENPLLRSGLALAGVNTWLEGGALPPDAEDAILTAEDVSALDLLATELVVLSACETGLGEVQVGEGVFGLRRAFVLAGAKTLVMSLWKVPDQQTQELMTDFYRRILAGEPRAAALREAQLALKAQYPDPLYWGAFICQGEPGPLDLHFKSF